MLLYPSASLNKCFLRLSLQIASSSILSSYTTQLEEEAGTCQTAHIGFSSLCAWSLNLQKALILSFLPKPGKLCIGLPDETKTKAKVSVSCKQYADKWLKMPWAHTPAVPSKSSWWLLFITTGGCIRMMQSLGRDEVEPPEKLHTLLFVICPFHCCTPLLLCVPEFLMYAGHFGLSSRIHSATKTSLWMWFKCDGLSSCHHMGIAVDTDCSFRQCPLFLW